MYQAMMTAATGLQNQQRRLDTIANNVANVNTLGFKSVRLDFKDALYSAGIVPGPARTPEGNQQRGHGLMLAGTAKDYRNGNLQSTEGKLDLALEGDGFFELGDLEGNIFYTRNGNFSLSIEPDGNYIVTGEGLYLLDADGMRILVPDLTEDISINHDGIITFTVGGEQAAASIGVYTFRNITGLLSAGNSTYTTSEASGERLQADGTLVLQGMLEGSNVNLAEEMTRMIRTQRAFQLASRALSTADEMEGIANNMKR